MRGFLIGTSLLFCFFFSIPILAQEQISPWFKVGNDYVERSEVIRVGNKNYLPYVQSKGWGKKKQKAFAEAYGEIMTAIYYGYISERGVDRKYTDTRGIIKNSDKGFDAYGEVAHFIDTYLDLLVWKTNEDRRKAQEEKAEKEKMDDITRILKKNR